LQLSAPRYYSPEMGRWPSRDPIGKEGGHALYSYTGNSPVGRYDFLGLIACCDCESQINDQLKNDPELAKLYDKLKKDSIPGDENGRKCLYGIYCRECNSAGANLHEGGHYGPERQVEFPFGRTRVYYRYVIVVCCANNSQNANQGTTDAIRTLYHEMQHAAEKCYSKDPTDCRGAACAEARARFCSGMSEKQSRDEAYLSARHWSECNGVSDDEIKKLSQSCELKKADCFIKRPPAPPKVN